MYDKLIKSNFDIVSHVNSKSKEKIEETYKTILPTNFQNVKEAEEIKKRKIIKSEYKNIKYDDYLEVNKLHNDYITSLNFQGHNMREKLYKAELTGAFVKFKTIHGVKQGIIVEERENTFLIVHEDDSLKIYPKALYNFMIMVDNIKYYFIGKYLKSNRFFKK